MNLSQELSPALKEKAAAGLILSEREYGGSVTRRLSDGRLELTHVWGLLADDPGGAPFSHSFWREAPPETADYWVAAGGRAFGISRVDGERGCLAEAENLLWGLGFREVYSTWRYATFTPESWKRWEKKWSKRCTDRS